MLPASIIAALIVVPAIAAEDARPSDGTPALAEHRAVLDMTIGLGGMASLTAEEVDQVGVSAVAVAADQCASQGDVDALHALLRDVAELAVVEPAVAMEISVAAAACGYAAQDTAATHRSILAALDSARLIEAPADRDRSIAWVADVGAHTGAILPAEIMGWSALVDDPRSRATIVRAWAIADALAHADNPLQVRSAGPYAPAALDSSLALRLAQAALDAGEFLAALKFAAALPISIGADRGGVLEQVFAQAKQDGDFALARLAATALEDSGDQTVLLRQLAESALEDGMAIEAALAAALLPPTRSTLNIWLDTATRYRDMGFRRMVMDALDRAEAVARAAGVAEQPALLARLAGRSAQLDDVARAIAILNDVAPSPDRPKAIADLAKRLAEFDRLSEAMGWAARIDDASVEPAIRARAFGAIAKALAEADEISAAIATVESRPDLAGAAIDRALGAIALALWRDAERDRAREYLQRIRDDEIRNATALELIRRSRDEDAVELFEEVLTGLTAIDDPVLRDRLLLQLADEMVRTSMRGGFDAIAPFLQSQDAVRRLAGQRIAASIEAPIDDTDLEPLLTQLNDLGDREAADRARTAVALRLAGLTDVAHAVAVNRQVRDNLTRTATFRAIAEQQAARLDQYSLIADAPARSQPINTRGVGAPSRLENRPTIAQIGAMAAYDAASIDNTAWPGLVNLSGRLGALRLQPGDVQAELPAIGGGVGIDRLSALSIPYNQKFNDTEPVLARARAQGEIIPHVIYVHRGVVTLSMIRERMLWIGRPDYLTVRNGVYVLRRPLVIGPDAVLLLTGADVLELRMSTGHQAYLVNAGETYVSNMSITSWDLQTDAPTEIAPAVNDLEFRPFIISWSGSRFEATQSEFRYLGYHKILSYGLSFTAGPSNLANSFVDAYSPRVRLVNNFFESMYFGFYLSHVQSPDFIGNEFRNGVVYGPDPHDYSDDVLMALNTAYGSVQKHGLIVSREVSGLFIGNIAFENHGSGIMLDRTSNNSIIYANTVFNNGYDGIAVYETGCSIVANNEAFSNDLSGIRIRNSADIAVFDNSLVGNTDAGITLYTDDLAAHYWRNLERDPFWTITTGTIASNRIVRNGYAIRAYDVLAITIDRNAMVENGNRAIAGAFDVLLPGVFRQRVFGQDPMLFADRCRGGEARPLPCGFREMGVFGPDGQTDWIFDVEAEVCTSDYRLTNGGLVRDVLN